MIRSWLILCLTGVACFIAGAFWDYPLRVIISQYFQSEFGEHVYRCDNAMREHFIAKSKLSETPSAEAVKALNNTEVGLLDCHAYDKFRKKLLSFGLNDDDLAKMGLVAIESKKVDLHNLVKEHEIRY